jgi:hypothetical protein
MYIVIMATLLSYILLKKRIASGEVISLDQGDEDFAKCLGYGVKGVSLKYFIYTSCTLKVKRSYSKRD